MQSLSEVFEQLCKICGCEMEIVKELENINDLSRGYMRTTVLCRCKHGHEDVRELELDGQKAVFSASVYRKEEWEQKTKKEEIPVIKLRDLLKTMDDYQCITIVQDCHEIHTLPPCAMNILKDSILDTNVIRIEGIKIYIDGGNDNA